MDLSKRANQILTKKKKLKAKRIKKENATAITKQLDLFVKKLGIEQPIKIYMYNDSAYINADLIIEILSSNIKNFKRSAEKNVHFITINRQIYVNKYGLTKLLADSREPVAFILQDYIYEVIYKLETNGSVNLSEIEETRTKLYTALSQVDIDAVTIKQTANQLTELNNEIKILNTDYSIAIDEISELKEKNKNLEYELKQAKNNHLILLNQAKKIAKYVKINTTEEIPELASFDDFDTECVNKKKIKKEAIDQIRYGLTGGQRRNKSKQHSNELIVVYIMQSVQTINDMYQWDIINELPNERIIYNNHIFENFKQFSNDYRLDNNSSEIDFDFIWYCDILISDDHFYIFKKIIELLEVANESSMDKLIDIFKSSNC